MRAQSDVPEDAGDAVHYLCLPHAGLGSSALTEHVHAGFVFASKGGAGR